MGIISTTEARSLNVLKRALRMDSGRGGSAGRQWTRVALMASARGVDEIVARALNSAGIPDECERDVSYELRTAMTSVCNAWMSFLAGALDTVCRITCIFEEEGTLRVVDRSS